MNKLKISTW